MQDSRQTGSLFFLLLLLALHGTVLEGAPVKRDWRIYSTSHFELLTDGSANQAELALERLERYRAAAIRMQGEQIISRLPVRVYLLLSSDEFGWMRSVTIPRNGVIGLFQPTAVDNLLAVSSIEDKESDGRPLLHEYTHLLLRDYHADWPLWLVEGFAQALETVELRSDKAIFGKPIPFGMMYLQRRGFLPIEELFQFELSRGAKVSNEQLMHFYVQSWAVCHYLYFGIPSAKEQAVLKFVNEVGHGRDVTDALQERLQLTPEQLQKAVKEHAFNGRARTAGYKLPEDVIHLKEPEVRPASPGEAEAWLGDWAIRFDPEKAESRYRKSLSEAPGNPSGLVGLSRCQARAGRFPEALENLGKAVAADPKSGWAWLYLAMVSDRAAARSATNGANPVTLPAGTLEAIQRAQELLPRHPAPFREQGRALALTGARLQEVADAYGKAAKLDPTNLTIPFELAMLLNSRGQKNHALALLEGVMSRSGKGSMGKTAAKMRRLLTTSPKSIDPEEIAEEEDAPQK